MAKITPIDVIKGISGKYGNGSNDYFATNSSSNKIRLAKLNNPYQGPASQKQLAQQQKFASRQAVATAWLNANKELRDGDGNITREASDAYIYVQKLKRAYNLSNITQVLYKYMDNDNIINLPESANDNTPADTTDTPDTPADNSNLLKTLSLSANPSNGGTVSGGGQYTVGSTPQISAVANAGYTFSQWNDGNTSATRTVTMDSDKSLVASFTLNTTPSGGDENGGTL